MALGPLLDDLLRRAPGLALDEAFAGCIQTDLLDGLRARFVSLISLRVAPVSTVEIIVADDALVVLGEVFAGDLFSNCRILVAIGEIGEHRCARILVRVHLFETRAPCLDCCVVLFPGQLYEGHHSPTDVRGGHSRVRRHSDGEEAAVAIAEFRLGRHLGTRLLEILGVVFGDASFENVEHDLGSLVEAFARGRHVDAERAILLARQSAPETEEKAIAEQNLEEDDALCDARRILVPGQDDGAGPDLDAIRLAGEIG